MCICDGESGREDATAHMWRERRELFSESVLSFHPVNPGDQTHIVRIGSRCLYPLNQLDFFFSLLHYVAVVGLALTM